MLMLSDESRSPPKDDAILPSGEHRPEKSKFYKASSVFEQITEKEAENTKPNDSQAIEEIIYPEVKLQSSKPNPLHTAQTTEEKTKLFQPENWRCLQSLPIKYRRLSVVVLVFLLVFIFITLLKPKGTTVQSFDNDNTFQLGDTKLDTQAVGGLSSILEAGNTSLDGLNEEELSPESHHITTQPLEQNSSNIDVTPTPTSPMVNTDEIDNTETSPSISVSPKEANFAMEDIFTAAEKANLLSANTQKTKAEPTATSHTVKILVMRKGVSLMQLFRENHLKIGDIMAMSKVPNGGQWLNRLAPKAKIQVYLTPEGNVSKMVLPNGGYFIREANQGYRYQG